MIATVPEGTPSRRMSTKRGDGGEKLAVLGKTKEAGPD